MNLINHRYQIIEALQTDAYGEVLLVEDMKKNIICKMRLFSVEFSQNELISFYQTNFVHYSTIVHPNLYTNYKFDIVDLIDEKTQKRKQFFYTYEKEIEQTIDYMELSRQEAMEVLLEICVALKYLHFRGIIYKYLTFDNIHIHRDNEDKLCVKLTDLATTLLYRDVIRSEKTYNQFIAPEIYWKERHSAQADIYSLGIVFYYLYHRYSYKNKTVDESLKKNIKNAVDKIVAQMIRISVVDEITSIQEFLKVISDMLNLTILEDDLEYYNKLQLKAPILERFNERTFFTKSVKDKFDKNSDINAFIIVGDVGIGKTRILDEAETLLKWEGHRVIRINCESNNSEYKSFVKIIHHIIDYGDLSQELIMKYGSEIVKFIPEYTEIWGVNFIDTLEEHIEQLRVKNRLQNFLREYSMSHKIVFIFDNIHVLDDDQLELLNHLCLANKENQYYIIGSYESENVYNKIYDTWEKSNKIIMKTLNNFNYDQASQFVSSLLGVGYNPIELTAKVMRDANGNLKHIKSIVKFLFDQGHLSINHHYEWVLDDLYDEEETPPLNTSIETIDALQDIPSESMTLLSIIALFKDAASLDAIFELVSEQIDDLKIILSKLVEMGIIKMKFDDHGETYDYCSRSLKRSMSDAMLKKDREALHLKIAKYLENSELGEQNQVLEAIIFHYSNGNNKSKAIGYSLILAKNLENNHMYIQAIEIYNRALGILHSQAKVVSIGEIYYDIARIYDLIGESELSQNFAYKGLDISREFMNQNLMARSTILLANLYGKRRDMVRCRQYIDNIHNILDQVTDDSIHFEVLLGEIEIYFAEGHLDKIEEILSEIKSQLNDDNQAVYLTILGRLQLRKGELGDALKSFTESIELFDKSGFENPLKALEPLNYTGVLYAFYLDEIEKGRGYFLEAIRKTESWNLSRSTAKYVRNLGKTYLIEDQVEHAFEMFIKALNIVESTMNGFLRADICRYLCILYLKSENYQKASFYLKKLESEFEDFHNNTFVSVEFYLVHIEYNLYLKDYDLAAQWCKKLRNSNLSIEEKDEFILKIFEYEVEVFRKQYFNYAANVDLRFVEILVKTQSNLIEAKGVRTLILRLAINLMNYKKYIDVHYLLKLDDELNPIFKTELIERRHNILKGVLKDQRIDYFKVLIAEQIDNFGKEDSWLTYKVLGDEYYDQYNYYEAIQCYFNAFDILKDLADYLPKKNRENYIFCDEVKLDLKSKINNIHRKLIGHSYKEKTVYTELEIRKADDFFDLTDYKNFVVNKSIQKSLGAIYKEKHGIVLDSVNKLIQNFGKNEIENIQLILKYCTQILMGDRGFIFILDEDQQISEVIKNSQDYDIPDLNLLLKSSVNLSNGILVNSVYDKVRSYPFLLERKGLLCIPIIKSDASVVKRRSDDSNELTEVKGYMYIDAKEAFNNFTQEPYNECMSLLNMLYFFVDNYNLKRISTIDKLTEVYLRSYFEDLFSRQLQRSKINSDALSVVMLDIDKFKNVNDTYGHRKGDEILYRMCAVIKNSIRETDLIGRYGGEEFILVFPNTNKENAYKICEKIRLAISDTQFLKDDKKVTISLGISSYPELGLIEEELIEKADQALYASKNNGRNQTTTWHADLGASRLRFDKLAGILEGNISTDTRNVQAIIDIMNAVKTDGDILEKIKLILTTISDVCEAQQISLVQVEEASIQEVYTKYTGDDTIYNQQILNTDRIMKSIDSNNASYFINWNDVSELDEKNIPDWKSLIVSPLRYKSQPKGVLIVSVPISTKEFSFNTTNFVNSISGVIATIL